MSWRNHVGTFWNCWGNDLDIFDHCQRQLSPEAAVSGFPSLLWGSFSFDRCSAEIDRCTEAGRTLKSARSRLVGEENFLKKSVGYWLVMQDMCETCWTRYPPKSWKDTYPSEFSIPWCCPAGVWAWVDRSTNSFFFQSQRANLGEFKTRLNQKGMGCYGSKLLNNLKSHFGHWRFQGGSQRVTTGSSQGMRNI